MTGPRAHRRLRAAAPAPALVERVMSALAHALPEFDLPVVEQLAEESRTDPFRVLIATLLSARTQDATTDRAARRLFARARTPSGMARLPVPTIARLIYPVSFYKTKARHVRATCRRIADTFGGRVPSTLDELLTLPGVGRKTATLVMIVAHASPDHICVDTHVHRISNRLGWVETRTPGETEQALYRAVDRRWWPHLNLYLVTWGQRICRPIGPRCSACVIRPDCRRVRVEGAR